MSLSKKPTTVKELKAALAKLPDSQKVEIYEGDDIIKRMPSVSTIKAQSRTIIVI